jgi:hypothetical protein
MAYHDLSLINAPSSVASLTVHDHDLGSERPAERSTD